MKIEQISQVVQTWARTEPLIRRAWLFGSRVRGDHRPDSDVDIAVELDSSAIRGVDGSGGFATFALESKRWVGQLSAKLAFSVDLQFYQGQKTPTIDAGLTKSSYLAYEKRSY